jgi:anaerobic selenocysteine-containing dehydrogenase
MGFNWSEPAPTRTAVDDPGPRVVAVPSRQFVDTFPGPAHGELARLVDPAVGVPVYVPPAHNRGSFPLTLISPASSKLINSMFGEFQSPSPAVLLHPSDAAERGLVAGQTVTVASPTGTIRVPLDVHDATRPGVAVMSKGVWLRHHGDGRGVNTLTPATGDELANGACFNDTFVEVSG